MKIEHGETQTGLFRKTKHYIVSVTVHFSEEEQHVIRSRGLHDDIVLERGVPSNRDHRKFAGRRDFFALTIGGLLRGPDVYALATPLEAKKYEACVTDRLKTLKNYLAHNAEVGRPATTFEL